MSSSELVSGRDETLSVELHFSSQVPRIVPTLTYIDCEVQSPEQTFIQSWSLLPLLVPLFLVFGTALHNLRYSLVAGFFLFRLLEPV